jgi:hypothetical protein
MAENAETVLLVEGRLDEGLIERAIAAAEGETHSADRIRTGLEVVAAAAEEDPDGARTALRKLRGDHAALARLEACLGGSRKQATLALGAAVQLAASELSSPDPDLRRRLPELIRWLERGW